MPFTFSHPAAVLPFIFLSGKRVSMTALAIGSMAPDFEFFFKMQAHSDISHTFKGIFLFNIPVVLVLSFLYHGWVRDPLLQHLPGFLQSRFFVYQRFKWNDYFQRNWGIVLVSAFIGVLTHFFCDAFTHRYGWFVHHIPVLASTVIIYNKELPVYDILQYGSSLVLGMILLLEAFKLPSYKVEVKFHSILLYWCVALAITGLTFFLRFWLGNTDNLIKDGIMTLISGGLLGIILASTISQLRYRS